MSKFNKVVKITLLFWLMKIIATTLGETLGDFIAITSNLGYFSGLLITLLFFLIVLMIQLTRKKYIPFYFWMVIVATTTLGTEISDFMDRSLKLGYTLGSVILLFCLLFTLFLWHKRFGDNKIYPIFDRHKEVYYWIAILFSNSLGTAFGDYLSDVVGLSYLTGAGVTAGIIVIVVLLHYYTKLNEVVLFWLAFIFTRPFGATFGDFLTKPLVQGGLRLSTLYSSLISLAILAVLIFISHKKMNDSPVDNIKVPKNG